MLLDPGNPQHVGNVIAGFALWSVIATLLLGRVYLKIWKKYRRDRKARKESQTGETGK
jgi:hypothetical protein